MNDFFANLFELWGAAIIENSQASFSNQMYDNGLYPSIGLLMCISAVLFVILYYFIINHARLSKWYWWGLFGLVVSTINFFTSWGIADTKLYQIYVNAGMQYPFTFIDILPFSLIVAMWTFVVFLLVSTVAKRFSINSRHTPWRSLWPKH